MGRGIRKRLCVEIVKFFFFFAFLTFAVHQHRRVIGRLTHLKHITTRFTRPIFLPGIATGEKGVYIYIYIFLTTSFDFYRRNFRRLRLRCVFLWAVSKLQIEWSIIISRSDAKYASGSPMRERRVFYFFFMATRNDVAYEGKLSFSINQLYAHETDNALLPYIPTSIIISVRNETMNSARHHYPALKYIYTYLSRLYRYIIPSNNCILHIHRFIE